MARGVWRRAHAPPVFLNGLSIPLLSLVKMGTDNAGWRLLVLAVMVSLMCVVFPYSPFQCHGHVGAAPVKWPMQSLQREKSFFPSGPLPNASDHCFCPCLPLWVWNKALPWRPSPDARVSSSHQNPLRRRSTAACLQRCLLHPRHFGMDTEPLPC